MTRARGTIAAGKNGYGQGGFAYVVLLFAVALSGAVLAVAGTYASQERQREREAELLFIGSQFRAAIARYYERSPGTVKRYPPRLEELLYDMRYLTVERHLRRLYADPMTGAADWGLVKAPDGGIMGIHSRSEKAPLKTGGFAPGFEALAGARKYREWRFVYEPEERGKR